MFLAIEQLRELIKSYTIAETVALASGTQIDMDYADNLLQQINQMRLDLATQAEMREIFWDQVIIPNAANANTVQNNWFSKNDIAYIIKRGIAALDMGVSVSLLNQGDKLKTITREMTQWQALFASVQSQSLGQQTLIDLPEALRFGANQALNIGVQGQVTGLGTVAQGWLFLHGATTKENLEESTVKEIQSEFIDDNGNTKYLPETQLVPLIFQFPTGTLDEFATDPSGNQNIFSVKNDRSVLLTHISTSSVDYRVDKLQDEGRNQLLCERIEVEGIASDMTNSWTAWYELPYPHLLRRGDRLKAVLQNGSNLENNGPIAANVNTYLMLKGQTV